MPQTVRAVFDHIRKEYLGGANLRDEGGTPKTLTVNTTATKILDANPNRIQVYVNNTDASNDGRIFFDNTVSTSRGFPMARKTGTYQSMYVGQVIDGPTAQKALWGIMENASGTWFVHALEVDV